MDDVQGVIERAWEERDAISSATRGEVRDAVDQRSPRSTAAACGWPRRRDGSWHTNQWLKKAVLLSFRLNDMTADSGRARRGALVGQGAVEIRGLGREPLPRGGLSRRARLRRPALGLYRAGRRS